MEPIERIIKAVQVIEETGKLLETIGKALENPEQFLPSSLFSSEELKEPRIPKKNPYVDSRIFKGQSDVDYCFECLVKHFSKAEVLLDEAEKFSLSAGKVTEAAAEKIRRAIQEIVGAEDDIESTEFRDPELKKIIDDIIAKMRDVRKDAWGSRCVYGQCSIDDVRRLKKKVEELLQLAYKGGELYISREQIDKIVQYLNQIGIQGDAAIAAAGIIGKFAAGLISKDEAIRKLKELLGWKKVDIEITDQGVVLRVGD